MSIASLLAALAGTLLVGQPAQAQPVPLAAIGDSYMAGIGAGDYVETEGCRRSGRSYAARAAERTGNELIDASCPGARIPEALEQSASIPASASTVLVQVGGNDVGFGSIATACLLPFDGSCLQQVAAAEERLPVVSQGLIEIASSVRSRTPRARLIMVGYPRLLGSPRQCARTTVGALLTAPEIVALNRLQARLDQTIRAAARGTGARFMDWPASVDRHSLCSGQPWFVTIGSSDLRDALHPTDRAYAAMGRAIARAVRR